MNVVGSGHIVLASETGKILNKKNESRWVLREIRRHRKQHLSDGSAFQSPPGSKNTSAGWTPIHAHTCRFLAISLGFLIHRLPVF